MPTTKHSVNNRIINMDYNKEKKFYTLNESTGIIIHDSIPQEDELVLFPGINKILIRLNKSYYHFMIDSFLLFAYINSVCPKYKYIFYYNGIEKNKFQDNIFLNFFMQYLIKYQIDYELIEKVYSGSSICLDNSYTLTQFHGLLINNPNAITNSNEYFLDYVKDLNKKPFRKVYIARKKENSSTRVYEEHKIKKFFQDNGFEIIYAEDFKNFEDQINFFYETKVLCGATGAGLTNAVLMQNGSTVIEITVPMQTFYDYGNFDDMEIAHHHFYSAISLLKEHKYISIPALNQKISNINKVFDKNFIKFIKNL